MATKIPDDFGDAGKGLAPTGGHGNPTLRNLLREIQAGEDTLVTTAERDALETATLGIPTRIWNSDDGAPQWWNGVEWVNALGVPT